MKFKKLLITVFLIFLYPLSLFSNEAEVISDSAVITLYGSKPLPLMPPVIFENDEIDFGYGPLRSVEPSLTDDSQLSLAIEFNERPSMQAIPILKLISVGHKILLTAYWDIQADNWDYFMERYGIPIGIAFKEKAVGFATEIESRWDDDWKKVPWFVLTSVGKLWWQGVCAGFKMLPSLAKNQVMIPKNMIVPLTDLDYRQSMRNGVDAQMNTVLLVATTFGLYKMGSFALNKVTSGAQVAGQLGKSLVNPGQTVNFVTPEGYMFGGMIAGTEEAVGSCVAAGPSLSGQIGPLIFFQIVGPDGGPVEKLPLSPKRFREELAKFGEKTEDLIKRARDQGLGVDDADYSAAQAFNNAKLANELSYECRVFHYRIPVKRIGFQVAKDKSLYADRYVTMVRDHHYGFDYAIKQNQVIRWEEHEIMTNADVVKVADYSFETFSEIVSSNPVVQFIKNQ